MSKIEIRRKGRKTAIALEKLADAIRNPGIPIQVYSHDGSDVGARQVLQTIDEVARFMGLNISVEIDQRKKSFITSNHFGVAVDKESGHYTTIQSLDELNKFVGGNSGN